MATTMTLQSAFIACAIMALVLSMSNGFTIDLIHREFSPQSPYYNSSLSYSQRLSNVLRRSDRIHHFSATKFSEQSPQAEIFQASGEYLMNFSIGTPPVPTLTVVSTGHDLIWTQCEPCTECFAQELPIFDPKRSSTFARVPCGVEACKLYPGTVCSDTDRDCIYNESYKDGSETQGVIASETMTLGSTEGGTMSFPNITFGCGLKNKGYFLGIESGVVGLGGGQTSLIRQLGSSIQGKFSYCLISYLSNEHGNTSKLNFGASALVDGPDVVSTPLINKDSDTFYHITLDGISIANTRLQYFDDPLSTKNSSKAQRELGNMFIDTGSTLTYLPLDLYFKVSDAVMDIVKLKPVPRSPQHISNLCYSTEESIEFPDMIFHFRGADVKLNKDSIFIQDDDVVCMAFKISIDNPRFGSLAQTNLLVGFDLEKRLVSFRPIDCSVG